jgi:hypothetical protein
MKKLTLLFAALLMGFFAIAQDAQKIEEDAIKELILTAYVDGLQNNGDLEITKQGFFPGFDLLMLQNGMVNKLPIYNWITYKELGREKNPGALSEEEITTCEFEFIDITGTAAVAKIHLSKGGKKIFTDYLSLYQFDDGWKIVSKIYFKIPE